MPRERNEILEAIALEQPDRRHMDGRTRKSPSNPLRLLGFEMEAAGIEPASESLLPFDPTCVVRGLLRSGSSHGRDLHARS